MKFGHATNSLGVVGHPVGVTSIKDLFYLANGKTEDSIREIAEIHYDGVELFDGNLIEFPGGTKSLKKLLKTLDIDLIAVYSGANFIFQEILGEELWKIEKVAETAAELMAQHLVIGGGAKRVGGTIESDYKQLGEGLNKVNAIAKKYGLTASFHPHLGTCVETPEQVDKAMSNTQINLCPDTAHLAAGGSDNSKLIHKYQERIKYVHLKDYTKDPFGFVPLGIGQLDLVSIVTALKEINYNGWITVETDGYPGNTKLSAEVSKKYLQTLFPTA
jgi:inosose dehydratase